MNRFLQQATAAIFALGVLTGCGDQILDLTPQDQLSDEAIWGDPALTEAYLNDIYLGLGHGLYEIMLSSLTDESHFIHGYGTPDIVQSIISPGARGAFDDWRFDHYDWPNLYSRIRQVNIFLEQIDEAEIDDEALRQRMKGEALFLRAYFYHNLLRMYGGVPIVTKVYALSDDFEVTRNSFQETVDFIVSEATAAAELLPPTQTGRDLGRATRGAALALKARTLLYAASDLYHVNPGGMPETGYTGGVSQQELYRAAKNAAREVMDLGVYRLFRPDPPSPEVAAENYAELFLTPNNEEAIFSRFFIQKRGDGYHPGLHNGPNGYHNWAGNTPIQQLVDDYQMVDGSNFDWDNPDHAAAPFENRDPRFYATILYDGAPWRERPSDARELDPQGIIQTFNELKLPDGSTVPGLDTRDGPIEDWNGSYSRYYLRKFISPAYNHQFEKQEVPWVFFRYAEVLLNYAEASIKLGEEADARAVLNEIRRRAGMPEFDASVSGQQLWDAYVNERRIEMAFEEQRFFDVRRWMIAPAELNENAKGINIYAEATDRRDRSTYSNYSYSVADVQNRSWHDKMYYVPIHQDEMNRNAQLVQNPGY